MNKNIFTVIVFISAIVFGTFFLTLSMVANTDTEHQLQLLDEKYNEVMAYAEKLESDLHMMNVKNSNDRTFFINLIQEDDFRIKMLSSEVMNLRIEVDEVSHDGCESKIKELWDEVETLKRMVK